MNPIAVVALTIVAAIKLALILVANEWPMGWVWSVTVVALLVIAVAVARDAGGPVDLNNLSAREIAAAAARQRYVLYLRPFSLDDQIRSPNPLYNKYASTDAIGPFVDFESLIVGGARLIAPVIKIGRPIPDDSKAGSVQYSDYSWREHFERLSDHAIAVVVLPGMGLGSVFELTSLKSRGHLSKCLFVLPKQSEHPLVWVLAGMALSHISVSMPDDGHAPTLFRVNRLDEADEVTYTSDTPGSKVADMVADIVADHAPSGSWRKWTLGRRLHHLKNAAALCAFVAIAWWVMFL